jgi:hypothetical protein
VITALAIAGALCLPVLADENPPAPQVSAQPVVAVQAAPPAVTPAKEAEKKPAAPAAGSPFQLEVGDATIRFGVLMQPQADFQRNAVGGYSQNLLMRRVRFVVGGQYAFTATGVLAGSDGRDTGVQARGYFFDDRLEYRAAIASGLREAGSRNAFRKVGRLHYNFFDKEVCNLPSCAGSNFGAKKILAVGAACDTQLGCRQHQDRVRSVHAAGGSRDEPDRH